MRTRKGRRLRVISVCVGEAEARPGKAQKTGINKRATTRDLMVGREGLERDTICNRKYHGGPEQAVYIQRNLTRLWWEDELGQPVGHGLFGENLCLEALDNPSVAVGDRFSTAKLVLEVTAPRMPCRVLADKLNDPGFAQRYAKAARPGFYCRVLQPGIIAAGVEMRYEPFNGGAFQWSR